MILGSLDLATLFMLTSAIIHAAIGIILKTSTDKLTFRAVLAVTSALLVFPLIWAVEFPPREALGFLAAGAAIHFFYQLSQISAFERGDMSLVYPIMRGASPALAAIFACLVLGETLGPISLIGLFLSAGALIGFGWPKKVHSNAQRNGAREAVGFALLCAVMIALYSVIDAAGMRAARTELGQVWSYMVWFFVLDCVLITPLAIYRRRRNLKHAIARELKWGAIAGVFSLLTFGLALYAFSIAPVAQMSAVRETSVVFGAIFAAKVLKEPLGMRRIVLACVLVTGLILLQL